MTYNLSKEVTFMENPNEPNNPVNPGAPQPGQPQNPYQASMPPQGQPQQPGYYQAPPQGQPPQGYYPPPQSAQPQQPSAASVAFQKTFGDLKTVCRSLLKDPVSSAESSSALATNTIAVLLAIQCVLMGLVSYITTLRGMGSLYGGLPPLSIFFYPIIITAVEIGIMFVCLFAMVRIFKGVKTAREVFSAMALASIPWSAVIAVLFVLLLILGMNTLSSALVLLLVMFALVFSICLLEVGLRDKTISNLKNLLVIAVAYPVQTLLFLIISSSIAQNVLNRFMYSMPFGW